MFFRCLRKPTVLYKHRLFRQWSLLKFYVHLSAVGQSLLVTPLARCHPLLPTRLHGRQAIVHPILLPQRHHSRHQNLRLWFYRRLSAMTHGHLSSVGLQSGHLPCPSKTDVHLTYVAMLHRHLEHHLVTPCHFRCHSTVLRPKPRKTIWTLDEPI